MATLYGGERFPILSRYNPLLVAAVLVATYLVTGWELAGSSCAHVFLAGSIGVVYYALAFFWFPDPPRRALLVAPSARL